MLVREGKRDEGAWLGVGAPRGIAQAYFFWQRGVLLWLLLLISSSQFALLCSPVNEGFDARASSIVILNKLCLFGASCRLGTVAAVWIVWGGPVCGVAMVA